MAKLVGRVSSTIKNNTGKRKVKAGSTNKSTGGILISKVIKISKNRK
jgi:hypothetical protein